MRTLNGSTGPKAAPIAALPRLIATMSSGVKPRLPGEEQQRGHERDQLFLGVLMTPPSAKTTLATGMTSAPPVGKPADEPSHEAPQRSGALHDRERTADEEDQDPITEAASVMPLGIAMSASNDAHRLRLDGCVGAGDDDRSASARDPPAAGIHRREGCA